MGGRAGHDPLRKRKAAVSESLFSRKHRIENERRDKVREAMKEYDESVYQPARKALVDECAAIGHKPNGRFHHTVGGIAYQNCGSCGFTLYEAEDNPTDTRKAAE